MTRRGLVRVGLPALVTVLLCSPVARRSDLLGAWATERLPSVARALNLASMDRHGSLDDALGQGGAALSGRGVLERLEFYGGGLVESSLGSMLSLALLVCAMLGARGWRSLLAGGALVLPPVLVLATRVRVQDERFLLPVLPVLVAAVAAALGTCRWPRAAWGGVGLLLTAGVLQMLAVDGGQAPVMNARVPAAWAPRAPVAARGWNRQGEAPLSPWAAYLEAAGMACQGEPPASSQREPPASSQGEPPASSQGEPPASIRISSLLRSPDADLHAWRWALLRACPGIEVETAGGAPVPTEGLWFSASDAEAGGAALPWATLTAEPLEHPAMRPLGEVSIPGGRPERVWVYRRR